MENDKRYMTMIPASAILGYNYTLVSAISGFNFRGIISEDKNRFTLRENMCLSVGDTFHSNLSNYDWCVIDADKTDTEEGWTKLYSSDTAEEKENAFKDFAMLATICKLKKDDLLFRSFKSLEPIRFTSSYDIISIPDYKFVAGVITPKGVYYEYVPITFYDDFDCYHANLFTDEKFTADPEVLLSL